MRVYVAGKAGDGCQGCIEVLMDDLCRAGHTITYDWTALKLDKPFHAHREESRKAAEEMVLGVQRAHLFILVAQGPLYGAMVEFGVALTGGGTTKRILIVAEEGSDARESVFFQHPRVQVITMQQLYALIDAHQLPGQSRFNSEMCPA